MIIEGKKKKALFSAMILRLQMDQSNADCLAGLDYRRISRLRLHLLATSTGFALL